ncbi:MAG: SMC-Scp complex subunit ScpB, partial [Dongiaceae bacterium]
VQRKLTRATIETLAIVAYHQPVTRADIEQIRGVSVAQGTLDILLEAGWVKPGPRRETPGRPMTWLTTDDFLHHFGLAGLEALPGFEELKASGLLNSAPPPGIAIPEASGGQGALPLISEALAMPELSEDSAGDEEI